jgi:hypothetical protein
MRFADLRFSIEAISYTTVQALLKKGTGALKYIETSGQFLLRGMDHQVGPNSRPDVCFEVRPPVLKVDRGEEAAPAAFLQGLCCLLTSHLF